MAKKNSTPKMPTNIDAFVEVSLKEAQRQFGDSVYVAATHEQRQRVLPIPYLSVRWLIESNGWPLSRFTQSAGPFGSMKSSFLFELMSWFLRAGGVATDIDTENKTSATLRNSIMPPPFVDPDNRLSMRFRHMTARTINDWNMKIENMMSQVEGLGAPTFPFIWGVDSMLGVNSEEARVKFRDSGEVQGRTFQDAPLILAQFFQSITGLMVGYPVTLHVTHHEKPDLASPGGRGMRRAGGVAPDYYATLDLVFRKGPFESTLGSSQAYDRAEFSARTIRLKVRKSSMGTDGKELVVLFKWQYTKDPETGKMIQTSWWDWSASTADILVRSKSQLNKAELLIVTKERKNIVGDVMWVDSVIDPAFKGLLPEKRETALPATEFGALVEAFPPELRIKIEDALHIQQHPEFSGEPVVLENRRPGAAVDEAVSAEDGDESDD